MKTPVASFSALVIVLSTISASCSQQRMPESVNLLPSCCMKHYEKVLPRKLVVGYRKALNCYLPAIIFVTKRNREVCTNPDHSWVQEYIKDAKIPLVPPKNLAHTKITRRETVLP
uniref:C-C motif chemokine 16 n=1 Tax=Jaculus jaculus TaxID=51337 RepID=UPI001E1AF750|nr:C-C motif chemokine 16 [Jaculus jaculus]